MMIKWDELIYTEETYSAFMGKSYNAAVRMPYGLRSVTYGTSLYLFGVVATIITFVECIFKGVPQLFGPLFNKKFDLFTGLELLGTGLAMTIYGVAYTALFFISIPYETYKGYNLNI